MDNQEVANEILRQLGGRQFIFATGVKNLVSTPKSLTMKLPRCNTSAKWLEITVTHKDLYNIVFVKLDKQFQRKIVKEYTDMFHDQLVPIFEKETNLCTKPF